MYILLLITLCDNYFLFVLNQINNRGFSAEIYFLDSKSFNYCASTKMDPSLNRLDDVEGGCSEENVPLKTKALLEVDQSKKSGTDDVALTTHALEFYDAILKRLRKDMTVDNEGLLIWKKDNL